MKHNIRNLYSLNISIFLPSLSHTQRSTHLHLFIPRSILEFTDDTESSRNTSFLSLRPTISPFVIPSESINISVSMAIKALPNVGQIRGDKSIRSQQIRASDLQRSEHEGLGSRAEARHRKTDLPCQTLLAKEKKKSQKGNWHSSFSSRKSGLCVWC